RRIDKGELHVEPHLLATIRRKLAGPDPYRATLEDWDYYRAGIANLLETPSKWPDKVLLNARALFLVPPDIGFYGPARAEGGSTMSDSYKLILECGHPCRGPGPTERTWFRGIWRPLSAALLLLWVVGLVSVTIRRRDRLVLFVPLVFQIVLLMFFVVEARYVIPLWSSMFLLAGVGTAALADAVRALRNHGTWSAGNTG